MPGETPPTQEEQPPDAPLTEAVDWRLPPTMEHEPAFDFKGGFEGPIKAIQRKAQLVEGNPLDQRYLHLAVTSTLEEGAKQQYSVKELDRWVREDSRTYTWTPGEPVQVTHLGVTRTAQEDEIEKITQRIYDAELYDPQKHKIEFKRQKQGGREYVVPVLPRQSRNLGRIVLGKVLKLLRRG